MPGQVETCIKALDVIQKHLLVGFIAAAHVDIVSQAAPAMFLTALNGARSLAPKVPLNRIKKGHSTLPSHEDLFVFVVYQGSIKIVVITFKS